MWRCSNIKMIMADGLYLNWLGYDDACPTAGYPKGCVPLYGVQRHTCHIWPILEKKERSWKAFLNLFRKINADTSWLDEIVHMEAVPGPSVLPKTTVERQAIIPLK